MKYQDERRDHRVAIFIVALFLPLLVSACSQEQSTAKPGVQGPLDLYMWSGPDAQAMEVRVEKLSGRDEDLQLLDCIDLHALIPLQGGFIEIEAETGLYDRRSGGQLQLDPPIYMNGILDGELITGSAEAFLLDSRKNICRLEGLNFVRNRAHISTEFLMINQSGLYRFGPLEMNGAPRLLGAVLTPFAPLHEREKKNFMQEESK